MNEQIFDSVISLTGNEDIDSLEVSLLSTIAEYVYCKYTRIYELAKDYPNPQVDMKLQLHISEQEPHFQWQTNLRNSKPDTALVSNVQTNRRKQTLSSESDQELWFPIKGSENKLCLYVCSPEFTEESKTLIAGFARVYGNYVKVLDESERDKLTGLLNRNSLERRLRNMLTRQAEVQQQLQEEFPQRTAHDDACPWLVIVDIDHFKKVNDLFGHVCGDEVLLSLAQKLEGDFRSTDFVFRFGGEEFVIIMEATTRADAFRKLNDFRMEIAATKFPLVGSITISLGFTKAANEDFEQLILERADKALYYAKDNGRNSVYCYEHLVEEGKLSGDTTHASDDDIDLF